MERTKDKGVTLVALVVTIVILLILASIGVSSGQNTIKWSRFNKLKTELRMMQEKVNLLNQENELAIGEELTETQKQILNKTEISDIIFEGKSIEEKNNIINQFRYCNKAYIEENFNISDISSDYLINVEKRIAINCDGFEYEGTKYYMIQQIPGETYNVEYNDKNSKTGTFEVIYTKEDNKWKVEITNINYDGYNENWEIKYKLEEDSYWQTSNELTFYVRKAGNYQIKLVHGDEIELQMITKNIVDEDELISEETNV
jgi:Tfp pilus assembly protein PilE